jgi:hypothetical protein
MENFNVYNPVTPTDQSNWTKLPLSWRPESPTAMSFLTANTVSQGALADWSIVRHVRDRARWYAPEPMEAWHHGVTCAAPPETHWVNTYEEYPFLCRNHMMTATNSSTYGVTYLTPNRMVDVSGAGGEAVVRFDVATLRSSSRDWIDLWLTPYDENLVVPLDDSLPDMQGHPMRGLHVRMTSEAGTSRFVASYVSNYVASPLVGGDPRGYEQVFAVTPAPPTSDPNVVQMLAPSATRRDTFELRISGTKIRFGMPRYDLWWVDADMTAAMATDLAEWGSKAVVQIGHHSFNPAADGGKPDTWHWDNIGMAPAVPFSIINVDRRYVEQGPDKTVRFSRAAPANSTLRFAGYGSDFEVRFDKGAWQPARRQLQQFTIADRYQSFWTPVPPGAAQVEFRAGKVKAGDPLQPGAWMARDITVWSLNP